MGQLTLSDYRSELLFDLRNRTDTGTGGVSTTRLNMWVNQSYRHLTHPSVHRHRELQYNYTITLVSGTQSYTYDPAGSVAITAVRSVHHILATTNTATALRRKLFPRNIRWFDNRGLPSGPPRIYALDGSVMYLGSVPSTAENNQLLYVRAWRAAQELTGDTDTSVLGNQWDEVLLLGARWRAQRDLEMYETAEITQQHYAAMLNEYGEREQLEGEDWGWSADVVQPGEYPT